MATKIASLASLNLVDAAKQDKHNFSWNFVTVSRVDTNRKSNWETKELIASKAFSRRATSTHSLANTSLMRQLDHDKN